MITSPGYVEVSRVINGDKDPSIWTRGFVRIKVAT